MNRGLGRSRYEQVARGVFVGLVAITLVGWAGLFWSRCSPAARAREAALDQVCAEQGARNARAWAKDWPRRLEDPMVLCRWITGGRDGCGGMMVCSVAAAGRLYQLDCFVGDGAVDEGRFERCVEDR
jgi:hypothetical protein